MSKIIHTFKLNKPVMAFGNVYNELNITEPTGKDVRECGIPFEIGTLNKRVKTSFDAEVMALYIERFCNIPMSAVDSLIPSDFMDLGLLIVNFLKKESGEESTSQT